MVRAPGARRTPTRWPGQRGDERHSRGITGTFVGGVGSPASTPPVGPARSGPPAYRASTAARNARRVGVGRHHLHRAPGLPRAGALPVVGPVGVEGLPRRPSGRPARHPAASTRPCRSARRRTPGSSTVRSPRRSPGGSTGGHRPDDPTAPTPAAIDPAWRNAWPRRPAPSPAPRPGAGPAGEPFEMADGAGLEEREEPEERPRCEGGQQEEWRRRPAPGRNPPPAPVVPTHPTGHRRPG